MIDLHTHVLPNIDDGSRSLDMSLEILKESYRQGISDMAATPHFYIKNDTIDSFIAKRDEAYKRLKEHIRAEKNIPEIYLGAEVYYFNGISKMEGIERLAINNGRYLLLEMPFDKWNNRVFQEIDDLIYNCKLIPVIAHIERFIQFQKGTDNIERLISMKVIPQMNGEYVLGFFTRGKAIKWLDNKVIKVLGSDTHNTGERCQNLGPVCEIIKKKSGSNVIDNIVNLSKEIIGI